jgi:hypothetical protein
MVGIEAFAFNILGSIALGVLMAQIIEFPVIRLRDRFFPPMQESSGLALDYVQLGRKSEVA